MRVWRLEDGDGVGIYNAEIEWWLNPSGASVHSETDIDAHPAPWRDGLDDAPTLGYVCGFESLDQGCDWFGSERMRDAVDFAECIWLVEFEVPEEHLMKGRRQVMFDPDRALLIRRHDRRGIYNRKFLAPDLTSV